MNWFRWEQNEKKQGTKQGTKRGRDDGRDDERDDERDEQKLPPEMTEHIMLLQDPAALANMCLMNKGYTARCNDKSFQLQYLNKHFPKSYVFLSKQWDNYEIMSDRIFDKSLMPVFMTINKLGPELLSNIFKQIEFV